MDSEAFKRVQQPTFFFLPHCASSMSHNLLVANFETLNNMIILGNSFVTIAENWSDLSARQKQGRPEPEGILRLVEAKAVVDVSVKECSFPVRGAFNDMSVMFMPQTPRDFDRLELLSMDHLLPGGAQ